MIAMLVASTVYMTIAVLFGSLFYALLCRLPASSRTVALEISAVLGAVWPMTLLLIVLYLFLHVVSVLSGGE